MSGTTFLDPGYVVGQYRVESLLGEGGMAAVYKVRHIELGTVCALKVLTTGGKSMRERMLVEGQLQSQLFHPNAVQVYHVFELDGMTMLLLEFVDGCDLDAWLADRGCTLAEAETIFLAILSAVETAHTMGLVHRDLKPANVLMAKERGDWVPKVADFGLAKLRGGNHLSMTRTGVAMGTPSFMAPEQIHDAKNVDQRADIFSLGCILYTLVCGRQPFEGNIMAVFAAIQGGTYTPPEELVPGLPERFGRTIRGCLEVEQEDRIPTCAAVRRSLLEPVRHDRVEEDEPGPAVDALPSPWVRRRALLRAAVKPAAAAVVLVGAASALYVGVTRFEIPESVKASLAVPADEPPVDRGPCPGAPDEVVGYAFAGKGPTVDLTGLAEFTFESRREVFEDYPRGRNASTQGARLVCVIEEGTVVSLVKPALEEKTGWWVPILPGAIHKKGAPPANQP